ncbi:MAG: peptidoglycan-binding domain-containing protein [Paracoccaceae bacterium]
MPLLRAICLAFSTLILGVSAYAQSEPPRIVAVLVSADAENTRIERLATALQGLNAETKIVAAPSDSELRALLQSFANTALESDVVIIYIDAPILSLGERAFVATQGLSLPRASALLTRAVPLSAFARAAALAENGGLVIVGAQAFSGTIPSGATQASAAPSPRNGLAPVVFLPESAADSAIAAVAIALEMPRVELGDMMAALSSINDVTQSQTLLRPVVLRAPVTVARTQTSALPAANSATPPAQSNTAPATAETGTSTPETAPETTPANSNTASLPQVSAEELAAQQTPPPQTTPRAVSFEELAALENNLSRSDKRDIQRGLRERGFYRGLIDGVFGRQTKSAIEAFQESIDAEPTGILTEEQLALFL